MKVLFRSAHALPHIIAIGIPPDRIEESIELQVSGDCSDASSTGSFWGRLVMDGVLIEYRAYTLPDRSINVGTYYRAKVN